MTECIYASLNQAYIRLKTWSTLNISFWNILQLLRLLDSEEQLGSGLGNAGMTNSYGPILIYNCVYISNNKIEYIEISNNSVA